jgi:hypothetical protein
MAFPILVPYDPAVSALSRNKYQTFCARFCPLLARIFRSLGHAVLIFLEMVSGDSINPPFWVADGGMRGEEGRPELALVSGFTSRLIIVYG